MPVGELSDEIAASDEPNVSAASGLDHLLVDSPDVSLHEEQGSTGNRRETSVAEDPARGLSVVAVPLIGIVEEAQVLEHPLVRRRAHRHRTDRGEELFERVLAFRAP